MDSVILLSVVPELSLIFNERKSLDSSYLDVHTSLSGRLFNVENVIQKPYYGGLFKVEIRECYIEILL